MLCEILVRSFVVVFEMSSLTSHNWARLGQTRQQEDASAWGEMAFFWSSLWLGRYVLDKLSAPPPSPCCRDSNVVLSLQKNHPSPPRSARFSTKILLPPAKLFIGALAMNLVGLGVNAILVIDYVHLLYFSSPLNRLLLTVPKSPFWLLLLNGSLWRSSKDDSYLQKMSFIMSALATLNCILGKKKDHENRIWACSEQSTQPQKFVYFEQRSLGRHLSNIAYI